MPLFRFYTPLFLKLLRRDPQMLFLSGPRQSGKTTVAKQIGEAWGESLYLNWDRLPDRQRILAGPDRLAETMGLERVSRKRQLLILDEFHKYVKWKDYLKSLYDSYHERLQILVTGSARLGVFHRGGDSLMGRYFPMNFHPLTLGELLEPHTPLEETLFRVEPLSVSSSLWEALAVCAFSASF